MEGANFLIGLGLKNMEFVCLFGVLNNFCTFILELSFMG